MTTLPQAARDLVAKWRKRATNLRMASRIEAACEVELTANELEALLADQAEAGEDGALVPAHVLAALDDELFRDCDRCANQAMEYGKTGKSTAACGGWDICTSYILRKHLHPSASEAEAGAPSLRDAIRQIIIDVGASGAGYTACAFERLDQLFARPTASLPSGLDLGQFEGITKGPWTVNLTKIDHAVVRWHIAGTKHGSVYPICEHVLESEPLATEQLANATAIAALPQLLAELRRWKGESK